MTENLKCYRVWFQFGDDDPDIRRGTLVDAANTDDAVDKVVRTYNEDSGMVVYNVECLDRERRS